MADLVVVTTTNEVRLLPSFLLLVPQDDHVEDTVQMEVVNDYERD
jgi:hypothetical protein